MTGAAAGYPGAMTATPVSSEVVLFGGLEISWDRRVLRPRAWTTAQSHWVAALASHAPPGPILELCCGAGQIGLLAATLTGRDLVQVDRDPVAVDFARRNARLAGVRSDVRAAAVTDALAPDETFAVAILDPPWVPSARVAQFPEDPVGAIDGGIEGTGPLLVGLRVALEHLHPDGHVVVQVGDMTQVEVVDRVLAARGSARDPWTVIEVRDYQPGGLLVDVGRRHQEKR